MDKVKGKAKEGTEKLFTVTWEERVIISAQIWAKSPEEAIKKAEYGTLDDLVRPSGCFHKGIPGSYEVDEEIEGAVKEDYKSGGNSNIAIHY